MLELKNIVKTYVTGGLRQDALKGISISFRESEFVSILGQSGSGKTTMLNIIGGLDRYTDGDLVIGGVSTKEFRDADWDCYRNNSIGFVFQSYHLIPHQTVLANVELALTLAGVSKKERRARAISVLKKVGLADHIHKKPNQMSGGQMQRVAIARALINNPEILLADEPTGALDSETSVQIMELLKEIAKDKLVIMVTHNPQLAEKYSTRIVRLLDGRIIDDSNPYEQVEPTAERVRHRKVSMSFGTALALSFNNLRTKKGRTLLTAFAGSIGIIGIALILSLSTGMNTYITDVQRDTMASYPLTISAETMDLSDLMGIRVEIVEMRSGDAADDARDAVFADYTALETDERLSASIVENNLTEFKKYLDDPNSDIRQYLGENGIVYTYDVRFSVYSHDADGSLIDSDSEPDETSGSAFGTVGGMNRLTGAADSGAANFSELMADADGEGVSRVVTDSYEVLYGSWPQAYDEVVLVLNQDNAVSAKALYQLGMITREQYEAAAETIQDGGQADELSFSYADACKHTLYLVPACDHYVAGENGIFLPIEDAALNEDRLLRNALPLKITGVIRPKADAADAGIATPIAYTAALTDYVIDRTNDSAITRAQESDPSVNVLTGMRFEAPDDAQKAADAKAYLGSLGISEKASFYKLMMYYTQRTDGASDMANADETATAAALDAWLAGDPEQELLLTVYEQYIAGAAYEDNLKTFGKVSYDAPSAISIYTDSFENKDAIAQCIASYNEAADEDARITYTDYVALLTSSITTIIDGISYVLIAFVAISLVVSCIMIGIITHISVMERTKEIGILRALGASKRNISQVFNAETFIIGCCAGLLGIGIALLDLLPINAVISGLSGLTELKAQLSPQAAVILILISIAITVLGGLIPAKKAARKDPVIALRTE